MPLSLERCNEILNQNGRKYKPDQVRQIRDFLYDFAFITLEHLKRVQLCQTEYLMRLSIQECQPTSKKNRDSACKTRKDD